MIRKNKYRSAVHVAKGTSRPPSVNPVMLNVNKTGKKKELSVDDYVSGILSGDRAILSKAITLVESSLPDHQDQISEVVERCLAHSGNSIRIGVTGSPGAGKSTFIESFGLCIVSTGRKLAVLTVDPSSKRTRGSILGDKTRMEKLSVHPSAFIRPSPAAGIAGGVARRTREAITLCEAAGFDTILVETTGVGQTETTVNSMVDFFLLLMLAGSGDELQGIKRGIMEMADAVVITKADGQNILQAETAKDFFSSALRLFPVPPSGQVPEVFTCSALEYKGIKELWDKILKYISLSIQSGYFRERRREQVVAGMYDAVSDYLHDSFYNDRIINTLIKTMEKQLYDGKITPYKAATILIDKYRNG
ncbi:MAG TPA: methylmalonyl Co-A mutase-associated GTPase MeaB [Bacteroidales bacterium]|nr:methylmalonyl Co-A mutase-associated GTPase MeaB [Bacteroidales bacterium]HQK68032.1 methylmalonyl Co-A mutase-associated GTPase MeaB [Bacteroidales bacterium]